MLSLWSCRRSSMSMSVEFVIGDKLPRVFEMVQAVYDYAPGQKMSKETAKRTEAVLCYSNAVIQLWGKAFGPERIKGKTPVRALIRQCIKDYTSHLTSNRKTLVGLSLRQRKTIWRKLFVMQ